LSCGNVEGDVSNGGVIVVILGEFADVNHGRPLRKRDPDW
jgi:hypothetical protein